MTAHKGDHGVHCWSCNQAMRSRLTGMAQMAAKLSRRNDLDDEKAVEILIAVYDDMTTFATQCPDCAQGIAKDYEQYGLRQYDNLLSQWHDFWCQVTIASLMTYMQRVGHDWHECSDAGGPVADSLPCLDCGAGT